MVGRISSAPQNHKCVQVIMGLSEWGDLTEP